MTSEGAKPAAGRSDNTVEVFVDLRSPYSYAAKAPVRQLADEIALDLDWLPFAIDIEATYGSADARDPRQISKTRYIYKDARRVAEPQGLVIRGPKRIYDADLAHRAMLYAKEAGLLAPFLDAAYEGFFTHTLDIEEQDALLALLAEAGADRQTAAAYIEGPGHEALAAARSRAEAYGVFGVPSFVYGDELFWGTDRLDHLRKAVLASRNGTAEI